MEGWVLKSANISCLAENIGDHVKQIVSIQLSGPGNVAIAILDYNSTVTLDKDLYFSKIEAEGNIEKETWKSHLTIMMTDILSSQSGIYTCEIHYFDQEGFLQDDITSNVLDAGEQDTSQVLLYMSSRISALEDKNADLKKILETQSQPIKDLHEAIKTQSQVNEDLQEAIKTHSQVKDDLQEAVKTQSHVIKDLQDKDKPCGFSARYDNGDIMVKNEVLLFRHVDTNIGEAYNATTGIFTAPRAGLYAFHLIVNTDGYSEHVYVNIYANSQQVGRVYAEDSDNYDQTSISVAVRLLEGGTVKPVVSSFDYVLLEGNRYQSVFSGYLVQAL